MKKTILAVATALLLSVAAIFSFAGNMHMFSKNKSGDTLERLWAAYEDALKEDRPQKVLEILSKIKGEARILRRPYDFYHSTNLYQATASRRNWKLRDSLHAAAAEDISRFDEPIVTFAWMSINAATQAQLRDYISKEEGRLRKGRNPGFYSDISEYLGGALPHFVRNDYEYTLWSLLKRENISDDAKVRGSEIYRCLVDEIASRYPSRAALDYYVALNASPNVRRAAMMDSLAKLYSFTAAGLYPRADILCTRFDTLRTNKASGAEFSQLYDECRAFEEERLNYKGDEAKIASPLTSIESLIDILTAKRLSVDMEDGGAAIFFSNLKRATLTLKRKGESAALREWKLENPSDALYAPYKMVVPLPPLDDGEYNFEVKSGKVWAGCNYSRYRLSAAVKRDARGYCIYVTDFITGKPVENVEVALSGSGRGNLSERLRTDGFTPLPHTLQEAMKGSGNRLSVQASAVGEDGTVMRSSPLSVYLWETGTESPKADVCGELLLNVAACRPGDTVHFKAILFESDRREHYRILKRVGHKVALFNSEGKEIASRELVSNDMGSSSSHFAIPAGERKGPFSVRLSSGSRTLDNAGLQVDDFVLPTFTLDFDERNELRFAGDEVVVSGKIRSYSGHNISQAKVSADITRWGTAVAEMPVETGADGTFSFSFNADMGGHYAISVKVTDATGETQEFGTYCQVASSPWFSLELLNAAKGDFSPLSAPDGRRVGQNGQMILREDTASLQITVNGQKGAPAKIGYRVLDTLSNIIMCGAAPSEAPFELDFSNIGDGLYEIVVESLNVDGRDIPLGSDDSVPAPLPVSVNRAGEQAPPLRWESSFALLKVSPGTSTLEAPLERLFISGPEEVSDGGRIEVSFGSAAGQIWAVATLYGQSREVYSTEIVYLDGGRGREGSLLNLAFDYPDTFPDIVSLEIFYFRGGSYYRREMEFRRSVRRFSLPLKFDILRRDLRPATEYSVALRTDPSAEIAATIYDRSLDAVRANYWPVIWRPSPAMLRLPLYVECGGITGRGEQLEEPFHNFPGVIPLATKGYSRSNSAVMMSKSEVMIEEAALPSSASKMAAEGALADRSADYADSADSGGAGEPPVLRSDMAEALAFHPHLRPSSDGVVTFSFRTSDKLSTFYLQLFGHDAGLHSATAREELVVSLPVKVQMEPPRFLYYGDSCNVAVLLSSMAPAAASGSGSDIKGTLSFEQRIGGVLVSSKSAEVSLKEGEALSMPFEIALPTPSEAGADKASEIEITARFSSQDCSDGVLVTVPVLPPLQQITEAHSAVLRHGADSAALCAELMSRFVNSRPQTGPSLHSLLDMVKAAIPSHIEPSGKDILSLTEAYYSRKIASLLGGGDLLQGKSGNSGPISDEALLDKIMGLRRPDGGFAWFDGMPSNMAVTAVVLERFAKLGSRGFDIPDMAPSVRWMDQAFFNREMPIWRGWITLGQYLFVRSLYPGVEFVPSPESASKQEFSKRMSEFRKEAAAYLVPSKKDGRGLQGAILPKARRIMTLLNLGSCDEGIAIAKLWGINISTRKKLRKSIDADILSLLEYSVAHRDGGIYYPNAVLPWRGLLEGEVYAHSLLCDMMAAYDKLSASEKGGAKVEATAGNGSAQVTPASVADGIRLWLMLQKESQQWESDPAYVDAISSVLDGSGEVLSARVMTMEATFTKPFEEIVAAGNGFTIERRFFRAVFSSGSAVNWVEIGEGEPISVGDKIEARYTIWNQENRSFVKLSAPHEASLLPVNQISGYYGWRRQSSAAGFVPNGYREVLPLRSDWYFDSYPEEKTVVTEEFFVTRSGRFQAPVVTIESLYAPHYRANGGFTAPLVSRD